MESNTINLLTIARSRSQDLQEDHLQVHAEGRVWCVHRRPHVCLGDLAAPQAAAHGHIGRAAGPGWQLGGALGRPEAAEKGLWAFSVHLHNSRNCGKTCARIRAHPNFFAYIAPI